MRILRVEDVSGRVLRGEDLGDGTVRVVLGGLAEGFRPGSEIVRVRKVLAPVVPTAILCIGLNYRKHAEESGSKLPEYPVLFMKSPGAVQNPGDPIVLPRVEPEEVDYEGELALIIGRSARNVSRERALDHVAGYACANDVSGRAWQRRKGGGQWCRGKGFDTFCPLGPALVTRDEVPDPNRLRIHTELNGAVVQDSNTSDMIFDVPTLVSFLSEGTTLATGTVILTGTPPGVGFVRNPPLFLRAGDRVLVEIEGLGRLENSVEAEAAC